ncbi:uncharacterized protein [Argopecten irradians]|uniref:uncharacterized protein n=1 Tax=Argopecten irradians TaxID=31199 RepID=UPI003714A4E1
MRFACAVLASLACLSVVVKGDGYGGGSYYYQQPQQMYTGYGKGGVSPYYNYGYSGYGKGGGNAGYSGYGGYPTLLYPIASPEPRDVPLAALGLANGYGGGELFGGSGDGSILLLITGAVLLLALLTNNNTG